MVLRSKISIAVLLVVLSGPLAVAQPPQATTTKSLPGVNYQGRLVGFQPNHLKASQNASPSEETVSGEMTFADEGNVEVVPRPGTRTPIGPGPRGGSSYRHTGATYSEDYFDPGLGGPYGASCGATCGPMADFCGSNLPLLWVKAEYLSWWTRGMHTPALATTSTVGTAQAQAGILGQGTTSTLFGGEPLNDLARSGGRFTLGSWFDCSQSAGMEVTYLFLGDANDTFQGSSNNFGILARPFFNASTNAQDARLISFPGVVSGSLNVSTLSSFQTVEVLMRQSLMQDCGFNLDGLMGYRFGQLRERVRITENTTALTGAAVGSSFNLFDEFAAINSFHGGDLGLAMQWQHSPCWSWEAVGKVALGGTTSKVDITGQTIATSAQGVATVTQAGLLTQGTNIGSAQQRTFGTITEFDLTLRRHFCTGLTASFGYTFMLWSQISRAGEQIDSSLNPTQIPPGTLNGAARPAFPFATSDYWAHGLRFGLEYQF